MGIIRLCDFTFFSLKLFTEVFYLKQIDVSVKWPPCQFVLCVDFLIVNIVGAEQTLVRQLTMQKHIES